MQLHNFYEDFVVQIAEKPAECPIGRQGLHDIKAAIMGDKQVVCEIVNKVRDLRKALAFHNNEGAQQRLLLRRSAGFGVFDSSEIKMEKQRVVKPCLRLIGKQADVLYDFLTIDNDQLLWFVLCTAK